MEISIIFFFLVPNKSSSNKNLYPICCVVTYTPSYINEQVLDKRLLLKCANLSHFAFYLVSFILPNVIPVINIYIQYSVLNTIGNIEGQGWIFRDPVWLCAWWHAITGSGVFVKSLTPISMNMMIYWHERSVFHLVGVRAVDQQQR